MNVDQFDFELPEALIAQSPLAERSSSRLLTLNRDSGAIGHGAFTDIRKLLRPGDALVLNDTRVIPARLLGVKRDTGAKVELLLLKALGDDRWEALVRPGKKLRSGAVVVFGGSAPRAAGESGAPGEPDAPEDAPLLTALIESEGEMGARLVKFTYEGIFHEVLDKLGHMPLPPYIKEQLADRERYQTVYARHSGSAAAPTAGLHFTRELLAELRERGVRIATITLHVGLGTFRPVSAERVEEHHMHEEYYAIGEEAARIINETKAGGGRVIAVGTTSCRTLESAARGADGGMLRPQEGWTDIFIYPGYRFRLVDGLLTNFHLPKSTLVMLVSALAGRERVLRAYAEAIERKYRFFSFGDAMLIYNP